VTLQLKLLLNIIHFLLKGSAVCVCFHVSYFFMVYF
jgi:hypothetical protein